MTEQEKQTRRARRKEQGARQALPTSAADATPQVDDSTEEAPRKATGGADAIKDRNKRLRDEAARKRASRKRERAVAATEGLDAGERVDDALTRSAHATAKFLKKNISWLQWVFVAGAAGGIGYLILDYRAGLEDEKESHTLMNAVAAQQGRIAGNDQWRSPDPNLIDPREEFASAEERLEAAEKRFRTAIESTTGKGPQLFAHLGLAGVLFDRGKFGDARAEYETAKGLAETASLPAAKGRALEGMALSLEGEGKRDEALKVFAQLADVDGFGDLGRYHQARLWHAQGESKKALEALQKLREGMVKDADPAARPGFLQASVEELMRSIDPNAVPAPGAQGITPEQLEQLQRQFEEMQRQQGQMPQMPPPGESPAGENPAPEGTNPDDGTGSAPEQEAAPANPTPTKPAPAKPAPPAPAPEPAKPAPAQGTSPVAPSPKQPAPTQPSPSQPAPAQPGAAQPAPAQPAPAQPSPTTPEATP